MSAEDAVQQAFLAAYQRIGQLRDDEAFETWLPRIVRNCALAITRKVHRFDPLEAADRHEVVQQLQAQLERAETIEEVRQGPWRLPPTQRASLVLRYYGGLSVQEIASATDISPGTVKWRLHEGRRRLREALGWPRAVSSQE